MNLFESLGQKEPLRVAVVGGGGKTTAVFQLAHQLSGKAWVSTTTHLGTDQLNLADRHFTLLEGEGLPADRWLDQKVSLLTGIRTPDERVLGLGVKTMDSVLLLAEREQVSLIIEADGARSHPTKAPAEHEPVIPSWVNTVIVVVGLSVLGKPLNADWVHRPEKFAELTGLLPGDPVTLESIISMLVSPQGGLKGVPAQAHRVVLLNQFDLHPLSGQEVRVLDRLNDIYDPILFGSLAFDPDHIRALSRH